MRITRITRTRRVLPVIAVSAVLLSGCGQDADPAAGDGGATPAASATASAGGEQVEPNNTVDVDFAAGMIPHHGQAVEMADLALKKASSPKVKDLAGRVKEAQAPEIDTLSTMLTSWGEPIPAATGHSEAMPGMDHGDGGMMTAEQMDDLEAAAGAKFDRMWVDMMIAHHEGAVRMSKDEIRDGGNPKAQQLAQVIADAQTKEIAELKSLLTELA
jgi:uncharacterized protein (DUF305 family)